MATINYYLDKINKKGYAPIHMRINCNGAQVKVSTKRKIKPEFFNKTTQTVSSSYNEHKECNYYLRFLKERAYELLNQPNRKSYTEKELKELLNEHIINYKENNDLNIVREQLSLYGKSFKFIDLFAGAGGFSEGFLQAEVNNKYFDFIAANDINDNCELTHIVRYNHQLGLDAKFLCQDITEPDFLDNLLEKIGDHKIDVVCGGPPCQSFSLAGKRKRFDKKDDLFSHYLEVIKALQPKYFVMENVKGILTKEQGKIKELIIKEINSIIDINEMPKLISFLSSLKGKFKKDNFIIDCVVKKIEIEKLSEFKKEEGKEAFIRFVVSKFRNLTPKIVNYKTSKTDKGISTIRHGFNILIRNKEWEKLKRDIIKEKDFCNIDNDFFVDSFTNFLSDLGTEEVIKKIELAFNNLKIDTEYENEINNILTALRIYTFSFDETINFIMDNCGKTQINKFKEIVDSIRLYRIDKPFVANASNYGVPQNRERVLFIGCRKDQKFISEIPPTVSSDEKVTVFEALHDLDFIGNNQEFHHYEPVDIFTQYNGTAKKMKSLIKKRSVDGKIAGKSGKTFAEWSKEGRLIKQYNKASKPFYVRNTEALSAGEKNYDVLNNHRTSKQNKDVIKRLEIILQEGNYKNAQDQLNKCGLASSKRNYNVLKPEEQSPTVMTIPDDYIHYNSPRALTVREMARLQSFDDSFVFQGKRSTGGNNRKSEVPQFTLVGNAVPPLLARAVGEEILKNIE
ncbi:MAG: DNA cytosine methyltransferase [Prolixibacteraceae bacterium]|nr:DNA cytosine methyltransferase [Prolixibacteraceae bacterium]